MYLLESEGPPYGVPDGSGSAPAQVLSGHRLLSADRTLQGALPAEYLYL